MTPVARAPLRVSSAQATAFRLARHRLTTLRKPAPLVDVVRDSGGIQAQVQSAAELAMWTRRRETTRDEIRRALWTERVLVKSSLMRLTLHIVPSADFPMYVAAMKPFATATVRRWRERDGAKPGDIEAAVATMVESLSTGPKSQQELIAALKRSRRGRPVPWLDNAWSAVRPAVVEGAIVYGPSRGAEATFVRTDAWLGPQRPVEHEEARAWLFERFLAAFGPATVHDFSKWSGLSVRDARAALATLGGGAVEASVDGASGWVRASDVDALRRSELDSDAVTLLGPFDSFLLAHATKEHLVDARFYKRVYRAQGWISAVVLRGGTIVGTWTTSGTVKRPLVDVALFARGRVSRRAIENEVAAVGAFSGVDYSVRYV